MTTVFGRLAMTLNAALEIAADGRVADRLLAHVAGLEEQRAAGVRPVPHPGAAHARLDVLLGDRSVGAGRLAEHRLGRLEPRDAKASSIGSTMNGAPSSSAILRGGAAGRVAREARRHEERVDRSSPSCAARAPRRERRRGSMLERAPARTRSVSSESRPPESATPIELEGAGLLEVVADAERERSKKSSSSSSRGERVGARRPGGRTSCRRRRGIREARSVGRRRRRRGASGPARSRWRNAS